MSSAVNAALRMINRASDRSIGSSRITHDKSKPQHGIDIVAERVVLGRLAEPECERRPAIQSQFDSAGQVAVKTAEDTLGMGHPTNLHPEALGLPLSMVGSARRVQCRSGSRSGGWSRNRSWIERHAG